MAKKPLKDEAAVAPSTAAQLDSSKAPKAAKGPKEKPTGYVNYRIADPGDNKKSLLRSTKGFALFDNKHTTLEERALLQLAIDNGGVAVVIAELRIIVANEKPDSIDISGIKLVG